MRKVFGIGMTLAGLAALSLGAANAKKKGLVMPVPEMTVAKVKQAPQIDGVIKPGEWKHASAFTGVTAEGQVGGHGGLVPEIQQVVWYMAYDSRYLYLAMRSPHAEGTYPLARVKGMDDKGVLFEDHVEIQILTHARNDATRQGKGFYKMMVNPKASMIDEHLYNGTIGTEELWSTGGPVKCSVTPKYWDLEMAIEIKRLDLKTLDNKSLVIQLVRTDSCAGMYYAGWVGAAWLSWDRFANVRFVPNAPSFQFTKLGEIGAGQLDAQVALTGNGKAADVNVEINVLDDAGKTLYKDSKNIKLSADGTARLEFKKDGIKIPKIDVYEKRRCTFEIAATAKTGRKKLVLYRNTSPFLQFDSEFKKKYLDPWLKGRPQSGEWEYVFSYMPYTSKLETSVDLDFFGVPAKILAAKSYKVAVSDGKRIIGSAGGEITNKSGENLLVSLPPLKSGIYDVKFTLYGADGKEISAKTGKLTRKVYPWENNSLGKSDEVIHPFTPLKVFRTNVSPWGRTYSVGSNGLFKQVRISPPTGTAGKQENLLAAPIHFEVIKDGKAISEKVGNGKIVKAADSRVDAVGSSKIGPVTANVKSFIEYDGWYQVEAEVSGQGSIDALDLVIDYDQRDDFPIDTLYVQRLGDGRYGNFFNAIPDNAGVCFKSTDLLKYRGGQFDWKSFVPRTYIGNGDRGLWFFAWSAAGWELKDEQAAVTVERLKNGNVRLRVRLLAGPVKLDKSRKLHFALQAAPVKPNHPRYRTYWEEGWTAHDTRGFRYYGISVDGFVNEKPEDYEKLRQFVLYGQRGQSEAKRKAKRNYRWWHYGEKLGHGAKLSMYGSGRMTGTGADEFNTFGSEWEPGRKEVHNKFKGVWNYQGTSQWKTKAQLSTSVINWTDSYIDFFIWYNKPLMEKSGFNGTWWDNTSMFTVRQFNPELGKMEETWGLYARRKMLKRLNVLGWQLMRPPRWISNMHVDLGWNHMFWMVENDWYADSSDTTTLDQWPMGQFRAMARTKSTMQVARAWLSHFGGTTPAMDRKVKRSLYAMLMSHDIHPDLKDYRMNKPGAVGYKRMMLKFRGLVNLSNTRDCLFTGYWNTGEMVKAPVKKIYSSVYTNNSLRTAAILLFNGNKQDKYLAGTRLDINQLIPIKGAVLTAKRIFDIETGREVKTIFRDGKYEITEPFAVEGHDFRMIGVEVE